MDQKASSSMVTLERSQLDLSLRHTRIHQTKQINSLLNSIEVHGQLVPVVVIHREDGTRHKEWLLIDGYRRLEVLKRLQVDQVKAECWSCNEQQALVKVMVQNQSRQFEAVEQAILIQELMQRCHLSSGEIARLLGRNSGWISRRLSLVESLDEDVLQDVMKGRISVWSATRVLAPMARAIPEHSRKLGIFLQEQSFSTRELARFWKHYQQVDKAGRQKMVDFPESFLKSLHEQERQKRAKDLKEGPEGKWLRDIDICRNLLLRIRTTMDKVIYPSQEAGDRNRLKMAFSGLKPLFEKILDAIERRCDD